MRGACLLAQEMVIVCLTEIEYVGVGIGSNTEFSISVNGQRPVSISTDVIHKSSRLFQKPVFMGLVASDKLELSVAIDVIEEDLAVDDKGQNTVSHNLQPVPGRQSLPVVTVGVFENRGLLGSGKAATFRFHFEAERWLPAPAGVRYVVGDERGWRLVRSAYQRTPKEFSLPHLLKVLVSRTYRGREYFVVQEGPEAGRRGSVALHNQVSRLSPAPMTREPSVGMIHHKRSRQLEVPGLDRFDVAWPPRNPFPVDATFHVEIPDFPHAPGRTYENRATFATSWFRIADSKVPDRYVHVGKRSAGCSTVTEVKRWDELYRFLINRRLDDRHVGTLTVVND
jgi:hypothetical protein